MNTQPSTINPQPALAPAIQIYMHWEGYGYIARCPEPSMHGWRPLRKTSGPKDAAAFAADAYYGPGNYTLHKVSFKVYEARRFVPASP